MKKLLLLLIFILAIGCSPARYPGYVSKPNKEIKKKEFRTIKSWQKNQAKEMKKRKKRWAKNPHFGTGKCRN